MSDPNSRISPPAAFLQRMQEQLATDFPLFVEALADSAPTTLRLNPFKPVQPPAGGMPIPWCPMGYYLPSRPAFYKDPLIFAGGFYVQEASSMMLAQALPASSTPLKVLDLCASPGGKSTLLASQLPAGSLLVSNELVGARVGALEENLVRWGFPDAIITSSRATDFSGLRHFFDLIVVDAPCSGEGMFRKDPDTIAHWSPGNLRVCEERQQEILEAILPALKPGGRLIYSTCTFNPGENEKQVRWLLDHEPGLMEIVPLQLNPEWGWLPGDFAYGPEMQFCWRALLHKVKGEGFFLAALEKKRTGAADNQETKSQQRRPEKKQKNADLKPRSDFKSREKKLPPVNLNELKNWLNNPEQWKMETEGEEVFARSPIVADNLEIISQRVRVMKAGVKMGKLAHGKFIPDHELALSAACSEGIPSVEVEWENAIRYLKKMDMKLNGTLPREWVRVTYQGLGLGWVKVLEGRINNHLPGHLRIQKPIEGIG